MLTWAQTPVAGVTGQGPLCSQLLPSQPGPLIGQQLLISPLIGPQRLVSHPWLIVNSTVGRKTAGNISAALSDDFTSSPFSQTHIQKVRIIIINLLSQPGTWDCKKRLQEYFLNPFLDHIQKLYATVTFLTFRHVSVISNPQVDPSHLLSLLF